MHMPRPDLEAVLSSLTPRERQIVTYVAAGRPNKVIAIDLSISLRTVEAHRSRIFTKLQVRNAMQLACRLCEHGRSGASPVPGAAGTDGPRGLPLPPGLAAAGSPGLAHVLHEQPAPTYGNCQTGLAPTPSKADPDPG
ncbi:response regulator transcription factor [Achromobacter insolitus]|uniref:response regulator transcription factor n=1 Tax=Achromobacter insolitus TaxID=217204 RepID=UPI000536733B|nr:LuxR C-terminal-related transcriptional regulator [Achromobacter insolitus]AVG42630.1 DNA-binding response regulator [Achromobacter insolitus]